MLDERALREQLKKLQPAGGGKSFNLNFFCHAMPSPDAATEEPRRRRLEPLYWEFNLSTEAIPAASTGRLPLMQEWQR